MGGNAAPRRRLDRVAEKGLLHPRRQYLVGGEGDDAAGWYALMWVFGYGSLMWDGWEQEFSGRKVDGAVLHGFRRAFNKASTRNWGTAKHPGPTLGLEPQSGAALTGVAFEFSEEKKPAVLAVLKSREGPSFAIESYSISLPENPERVPAFVPVNDRNSNTYIGDIPIAERAKMAAAARGTSGRCMDYARNVQRQLSDLGIADPQVAAFVSELESSNLAEVSPDDFSRRFALRAENLMWFLGAGASAAAGIPTALDMIWEFKQQLYVSQRRISPKLVEDLSNPSTRARLQAHIDSLGNLPAAGAPDEYARLFEAVYPSEADRRAYIEAKIAGGKPSFGHLALATLMRARRALVAWTTNFDHLVADACAKVYGGTAALTSVALDAPDVAAQRIAENRWPLEVKLHGDFRSRRLKNTGDELRLQDTRMRKLLVESSRRFGLVVVGYSGRDSSVMDAIEEALQESGAFPNGLFWLHRGESSPLDRVTQLLLRARTAGVEAALVRVQNFDETMRDLLRLIVGIDTEIVDAFSRDRRRRSPAAYPGGRQGWPVVRLNAIPVTHTSVCRRVVCQVGGYPEVRAAVNEANVDVLVARVRAGVLAFGRDADVRSAFVAFGITEFDLHPFDAKRLRYDSGERGLLRQALSRALARNRRLDHERRRSTDLFAPTDVNDHRWRGLQQVVSTLSGTVDGFPELRWREGIGTRLDWADERLWLLIEPRVVFQGISEANRSAATAFARERTVRRYNQAVNELVNFWATVLAGDSEELRALNVADGVDAVFVLKQETAFSRRIGA